MNNVVSKFLKLHIALRYGIVIVGVFLLFNVIFLLYPSAKFLPSSSLAGVDVSGLTAEQARIKMNQYIGESSIDLAVSSTTEEINLTKLGVGFSQTDAEEHLSANRKTPLPVIQFLFSYLSDHQFQPSVNQDALKSRLQEFNNDYFVDEEFNYLVFDPTTGGVSIAENPANDVLDIEAALNEMISQLSFTEKPEKITLPTMQITSDQQISNLEDARREAETLATIELTLSLDGEDVVPPVETRISWVDITYEDAAAIVSVNQEAIETYLEEISTAFNTDATTRNVSLLDGEETSSSGGSAGRELDIDKTAKNIIARITSDDFDAPSLNVSTKTIPTPVVYDRKYTNTSKGLQAKIDFWIESHGGSYGVTATEMQGSKRIAFHNQKTKFVAASTYKLFLAYIVLSDVENGDYTLNSSTSSGLTVEAALRDAIVNSGNDTAISLAEKAGGWASIDSQLASAGYGSTTLNNYVNGSLSGDKMTTASDLNKLLEQLYSGTLLNSTNTAKLRGWMQEQIYREGIPAGVDGTVADKVGFLEGYLHDAAIVYTDHTDYILVILSNNSSWANIADLASVIGDHFST